MRTRLPVSRGFIPKFYLKSPTLPGHGQRSFGLVSLGSLPRRYPQTGLHRQVAPDKIPGGLCLLLSAVQYPGTDGSVAGNILRPFRNFESKKLKNGAIRNAFGNFSCPRFSRNNAKSSSYDPQFRAFCRQFLMLFWRRSGTLSALSRRMPCPRRRQSPCWIRPMSLCSVYFFPGKPRTTRRGCKSASRTLQLAANGRS